jgi:hypothetical protein
MRTPVVLVARQGNTGSHRRHVDRPPRNGGHQARIRRPCRWVSALKSGVLSGAELPLELAHGCTSCTIRDDLLVLLCQLHRRDGDRGLTSPPTPMRTNRAAGDAHVRRSDGRTDRAPAARSAVLVADV